MFSDLTPEGKRYVAELKKIERLEVQVGYWRGEKTEDDGTDLVDIAAYNELGTPTIPARPFMKQSFENHESDLQNACDEVNAAISRGSTAVQALENLGTFGKALVQQEIVDGEFEPNAAATISKKGSERPLIDTGHMRQSVDFKVVKRT